MKLCVALDMPSRDENLALVKQLNGLDLWLKVGLRSFLRDGAKFIDEIRQVSDFKIFLDLKLHDIPNTMSDAADVIAGLGVDMITLHASAGKRAMSEVMARLSKCQNHPLVFAVSALTSFSDDEFRVVYNDSLENSVRKFSTAAYEAGVDGMVCSVFESAMIKMATSQDFLTLTPGIRPFGESANDQSRVADLSVAKRENSDFIVIGRPIYEAQNPREVAKKILAQI
ncbi:MULTISPECIES: orotidine-5'-phosphate decarboxylase [unclassified Campylobacter]|uniref:orotidine-5'-phosphate decarboxylase n=1 Tax=unclassified Campylobacter TaxID=2593542 RepID=UPI003D35678D